MQAIAIAKRTLKWRMKNMVTIMMTITQPLIWLLLFSQMFQGNMSEDYTAFVLPGILVMNILSGAGMSGIANYSLIESGSYYRLYVSPIERGSIVIGQVLDNVIIMLVETLFLFLIGVLFGVSMPSLLPMLLILGVVICSTSIISMLSYAVSYLFQDENPFIALVNALMLPLFFLSTALMPLEAMPSVFQTLVRLNPLTYIINVLRSLLLEKEIAWGNITILVCVILFVGCLMYSISKRCIEQYAHQ